MQKGSDCGAEDLALGLGPRPDGATGERAIVETLTNAGASACSLSGYPTVALLDSTGSPLAFRYTQGASQYVTHAAPSGVHLQSGATAYVLIAKYRCDGGEVGQAATIQLALEPGQHPATTAITGDQMSLATCSGGPDDPGQIVDLSPFEPSVDLLFPTH